MAEAEEERVEADVVEQAEQEAREDRLGAAAAGLAEVGRRAVEGAAAMAEPRPAAEAAAGLRPGAVEEGLVGVVAGPEVVRAATPAILRFRTRTCSRDRSFHNFPRVRPRISKCSMPSRMERAAL